MPVESGECWDYHSPKYVNQTPATKNVLAVTRTTPLLTWQVHWRFCHFEHMFQVFAESSASSGANVNSSENNQL